ncbi:MAG: DMT family transporter [Saprospiraceae bacterium]
MEQRAVGILVLCAVLAGLSGILIKMMPTMNASNIGGLRMALPVIGFGLYLKLQRIQIFRRNYKKMIFASGLNAFRLYFYFIAYIYTSVGSAAILFYCFPIFVALMGHWFLEERMSRSQWMFLFLAFCGLIVAYSHQSFSFDNSDFIGMSSALVAGLGYAVTVVLFKSESQNYNSSEMVFYQNLVGMFIFMPFLIKDYEAISSHDIWFCLIYTFVVGFVVFKLFFIGLKYLDASIASSIMYLEIVSAIFFSYIFLGEKLSSNMILGGAMIVISSFMINRLRTIKD